MNGTQSVSSGVVNWSRLISVPLLAAASTVLALVVTDTLYFRGNVSALILTPLNFVRYNASPDNLAKHGHHPKWLHVVVNLPMVVGPGLLYYGIVAAWQILKTSRSADKRDDGVVEVMKRSEFSALEVIVEAH